MSCGGRNFRFREVVPKIVETLRPPGGGPPHLGQFNAEMSKCLLLLASALCLALLPYCATSPTVARARAYTSVHERKRARSRAYMCTPPVPQVPPPQAAAPASAPASAKKTFSDNWSGAGRFADDEPLPLSFWLLGPSPRRGILTSLGIWGLIAPATNLWGTGSFLLSLNLRR